MTEVKGMEIIDLEVSRHNCIFLLTPLTSEGRAWLHENIHAEPWQWLGNSLSVDQHYVAEIVVGAMNDGLQVI